MMSLLHLGKCPDVLNFCPFTYICSFDTILMVMRININETAGR